MGGFNNLQALANAAGQTGLPRMGQMQAQPPAGYSFTPAGAGTPMPQQPAGMSPGAMQGYAAMGFPGMGQAQQAAGMGQASSLGAGSWGPQAQGIGPGGPSNAQMAGGMMKPPLQQGAMQNALKGIGGGILGALGGGQGAMPQQPQQQGMIGPANPNPMMQGPMARTNLFNQVNRPTMPISSWNRPQF